MQYLYDSSGKTIGVFLALAEWQEMENKLLACGQEAPEEHGLAPARNRHDRHEKDSPPQPERQRAGDNDKELIPFDEAFAAFKARGFKL